GSHIKTECDVTETDATDGQQLTVKSIEKTYDLNDKRVDKECIVRQTDPTIRQRVGPQRVSQSIEALNKKVTIRVINKIATQNTPKTAIATQSQSQDKKVVYLVVNSGNQMTGQTSGTSASGQQLMLVSLGKVLRCHVIDCQFKCHSMDSLQTHLKVHDRSFQPQPMAGFASLKEQREVIDKQCYDSTTNSYHCRQTGCQKRFQLYESLVKHLKHIHCERLYICYDPNCGKRFKRCDTVRNHYNTIHSEVKPPKPFGCPVDGCDQRYPSASSLAIHVKSHDNHERLERDRRRRELIDKCYDSTTDSYHCRQTGCEKSFKNYECLYKHMKQTHVERAVICDHSDCDKRFKRQDVMREHYKRIHGTVRVIKCPIGECGLQYRRPSELNQHMVTAHPSEYTLYLRDRRAKLSKGTGFRCQHPGCGRGFNSRNNLLNHRALHTTEPTIRCPKCPQLFRTTNLLYKHQVSQHNRKAGPLRKDYRCERPGCQYTGTLAQLRSHTTLHTGEKPFACDWPECGKRFRLMPGLTDHMNNHQNIKSYACHWPGYKQHFRLLSLRLDQLSDKQTEDTNESQKPQQKRLQKKTTKTPQKVVKREDNDLGVVVTNEDSDEEWRPSTASRTPRKGLKGKRQPIVDKTLAVYQCDHEDCDYCTHLWPNLVAHRKTHDNIKSEATQVVRQEPPKRRCVESTTDSYVCDECQRGFKGEAHLRQHVIHAHTKPDVRCDYADCDKRFRTQNSMRRHCGHSHKGHKRRKSSTTTTVTHVCPHEGCDRRYKIKQQLDRHLVAHQTVRPFACDFEGCTKSYESANGLRRHQLIHFSNGSAEQREDYQYKRLKEMRKLSSKTSETFRCDREGCEYRTNVYTNLTAHRMTHYNAATEAKRVLRRDLKRRCYDSATNTYVCHHIGCQKVFKLLDQLRGHVIVTHSPRNIVCDYADCGKVFKSKKALRTHCQQNHAIRQFVCPHPDCGRRYPLNYQLKVHLETHVTERLFACDVDGCHKRFKSEKTVKNHQLTHNTKPTVKCTVDGCTERFLTQHFMIRHRISVHNFKPYDTKKNTFTCQWPGCEYTSHYKHRLDTHQNSHTGERPFICEWPDCDKAFTDPSGLRTHMNIHQNVQPFACQWPGCTYRSSDHSSRYKHYKKVHKKSRRGPTLTLNPWAEGPEVPIATRTHGFRDNRVSTPTSGGQPVVQTVDSKCSRSQWSTQPITCLTAIGSYQGSAKTAVGSEAQRVPRGKTPDIQTLLTTAVGSEAIRVSKDDSRQSNTSGDRIDVRLIGSAKSRLTVGSEAKRVPQGKTPDIRTLLPIRVPTDDSRHDWTLGDRRSSVVVDSSSVTHDRLCTRDHRIGKRMPNESTDSSAVRKVHAF
ncbi:unnamed protein product, partial [Medioppia subpectinata]